MLFVTCQLELALRLVNLAGRISLNAPLNSKVSLNWNLPLNWNADIMKILLLLLYQILNYRIFFIRSCHLRIDRRLDSHEFMISCFSGAESDFELLLQSISSSSWCYLLLTSAKTDSFATKHVCCFYHMVRIEFLINDQ